jgi:cyclopropane fatty-acyl-phospholipid synthase-like methyltransferase
MDDVSRLYNNLSRFTYYLEWIRQFGRPNYLSMHKPLNIPLDSQQAEGDKSSMEDLDDLLYRLAELPDEPKILDAGCGFGATLFKWQQKKKGTYIGYSNSSFQVKVAQKIARRLNLEKQCQFHLKGFEEELSDQFDAIICVEALLHATDRDAVLNNFARNLKPGGRLIIVDDIPQKQITKQNVAYQILRNAWYLPEMRPVSDLLKNLSTVGLELKLHRDLTKQIKLATSDIIESRLRRLKTIIKLLPFNWLRLYLNTHRGGYALQKLYQEGLMGYHLIVARKRNNN